VVSTYDENVIEFQSFPMNKKKRKLLLLAFCLWERHTGTLVIFRMRCHWIPYIDSSRWFWPSMEKLLNFIIFVWIKRKKTLLPTFCLWQWYTDILVILKRRCHWIPYIDNSSWFWPTMRKLLNFKVFLWLKERKLLWITFCLWQL